MAENQYLSPPSLETIKKEKKKKDSKESHSKKAKSSLKLPEFLKDPRFKFSVGALFMVLSASMLFAFTSHFFSGKEDFDLMYDLSQNAAELGKQTKNNIGYSGSILSHYFINQWFGIGSFCIVPILFLFGLSLITGKKIENQVKFTKASVFSGLWISVMLGFILNKIEDPNAIIYYSGGTGFYIAQFLNGIIGWGTFLLLGFVLLLFMIYFFDFGLLFGIVPAVNKEKAILQDAVDSKSVLEEEELLENELSETTLLNQEDEEFELVEKIHPVVSIPDFEIENTTNSTFSQDHDELDQEDEVELEIAENEIDDDFIDFSGELDLGTYDPTLDLSYYKYPTADLLADAPESKVKVSMEELSANKNKIVETLGNYKIGISSIKATIGPTVTLYEIIPEAGIKISKIKNLEDDIALSLAALGIRIIAPIPGKGTIGIEVPNKERELVSFKSLLTSEKFMNSKMALPVVLGKTITNEIFMIDLTKMPHMLMAGATGQGKSVGLNIILASLLYKKHPAQLKFVLVDPKKVELSIFSKIERHFLAKLPGEQEAIITDTSKVINTLNSLCIEMDSRYDLLKLAGCRNLGEYNKKFIERRLNPEKGHKFMPYIVLVIDELADLMMTAGKEVETPIARLAQLARAIGIHLVVATQRPSVNVITGIIKANFPARISFKVTSKIDSRTILDTGGADQLIGMGDMLISQGSEIIRVQCGFVDTHEIDAIVDFIGSQQGYSTAFHLPEYVGEGAEDQKSGVDLSDRDSMFDEAARIIVSTQQGSTSLIQRKLKLGYNRAGRIVDQMEAAGIVGPFQGAKARDVYIQDENTLEQLLKELDKR